MASNHAVNLLFDKMFELLWQRYDQSIDNFSDKKMLRSKRNFHTAQAIAYNLLMDDLQELREIFTQELNEN
ncbi:hypothetical protein [Scytonema sp. NUACC26]|uniref:hypothetical protein n=1 Tax=Scytonema sp. NUACC26 TaxID=3140176 RepID=UPI0034DB8869